MWRHADARCLQGFGCAVLISRRIVSTRLFWEIHCGPTSTSCASFKASGSGTPLGVSESAGPCVVSCCCLKLPACLAAITLLRHWTNVMLWHLWEVEVFQDANRIMYRSWRNLLGNRAVKGWAKLQQSHWILWSFQTTASPQVEFYNEIKVILSYCQSYW